MTFGVVQWRSPRHYQPRLGTDNERLCTARGDPVTYTVERTHWSNRLQEFVPFRLTYLRTWIAERELWSDFLVRSQELESPQEPHPMERQSSNRAEVLVFADAKAIRRTG